MRFSQYFRPADLGDKRTMPKIDADWIRERIGTERGAVVRLAEAVGMHPNHLSKVMSRQRRLNSDETIAILEYFSKPPELAPELVPLLDRIERLSDGGRARLEEFADFLLEKEGKPPVSPERQD